MHKHAEGGFQEFKTSHKIKLHLMGCGLHEKYIHSAGGTGWFVDIVNEEAESSEEKKEEANESINSIAIRADMDALPMPEKNGELSYKTVTDHAHMCGHDGHTTCLLGFA